MVTTNQRPTIDIPKIERKEHKHNTEENHQTTRETLKEESNGEELQKQPENK